MCKNQHGMKFSALIGALTSPNGLLNHCKKFGAPSDQPSRQITRDKLINSAMSGIAFVSFQMVFSETSPH